MICLVGDVKDPAFSWVLLGPHAQLSQILKERSVGVPASLPAGTPCLHKEDLDGGHTAV